jgi:4'-phosphopantetheinyl transferase
MEKDFWDNIDFTPTLQTDTVHVWRTWLDPDEIDLNQIKTSLSKDEHIIANKFHFKHDRHRYMLSHGILREILSQYLFITPESICFSRDETGKPVLEPNPGQIQFNMSHSGEMALFAFTQRHTVGVDIEHVHPIKDLEATAKLFLSSTEMNPFLNLPQKMRLESFFRAWTRKEALTKAMGRGLAMPLDQLEVGVNPMQRSMFKLSELDGISQETWQLVDLTPAHHYVGALAMQSVEVSLCFFTYPQKEKT